MKTGNFIAIVLLAITIAIVFFLASLSPENTRETGVVVEKDQVAGTFFAEKISEGSIKAKYQTAENFGQKVRILVVPGHDDNSWGTFYAGLKEADLVLDIGEELVNFLKSDPRLEVVLTRGESGYLTEFENYFVREREAVSSFVLQNKTNVENMIRAGTLSFAEIVPHNDVYGDNALRLYAMNKWANDTKVDFAIHLHANDYARRSMRSPGKYSGFAVYIPERQFSNAEASRVLGQKIFEKLKIYYPPSDMPKENGGLVEDQELIALGAFNTLNAPAALIEYGFIYEPYFSKKTIRPFHVKEMAFKTYQGILEFLGAPENFNTSSTPYLFEKDISSGAEASIDILMLQKRLIQEGLYPPNGKSLRDCPLQGNFKSCTVEALKSFQEKYGVEGDGTILGPKTREKLNS